MRPWLRNVLIVVALLGGGLLGALFGTRTGRALMASTDAFMVLPTDNRVRYEPEVRTQAEAVARALSRR